LAATTRATAEEVAVHRIPMRAEAPMANELTTGSNVTIEAPASAVWKALTDPTLIERWFLGVKTETTWEQGASIVHRGEWQGRPYEDKGEIVRIEPERLLVHTHWSDLSATPDSAENYQQVEWKLRETPDGRTEVMLTETNLPSAEAKAMSERTWPMVLANLKAVVEDLDPAPSSREPET
jgi:uncharacterized protein YndB with AHSA1/START domain